MGGEKALGHWKPAWESENESALLPTYTHSKIHTLLRSHCVLDESEPPGTHTHAIAQVSGQLGDGRHWRLGLARWRHPVRNPVCLPGEGVFVGADCLASFFIRHNRAQKTAPTKSTVKNIRRESLLSFLSARWLGVMGSLPFLVTHWWVCFWRLACQQQIWEIRAGVFQSYGCTT